MDKTKDNRNLKPKTSIISKLIFLNSFKLFKTGQKKDIEVDDVNNLQFDISSDKLGTNLEDQWNELANTQRTLTKVLLNCHGPKYLLYGFLQMLIEVFLLLTQPYLFGKVVSFFTPGQTDLTKNQAIVHVVFLISIIFFRAVYRSNYAFLMMTFGIRIRTALCSFLYRKILQLEPHDVRNISGGKMLTLITKDVETIEATAVVGNDLWISAVKVMVVTCILYVRIGGASLVGIGCFIIGLPLQLYLSGKVKSLKLKMCKESEDRLQTIQETISGIRIIKMYTWENFFQAKIHKARKREISTAFKMFIVRFAIFTIGFINSEVGFYLMLMTYIWLGNNITGEIVYFITSLYVFLIITFNDTLPNVIFKISESSSATKRIEETFRNEELKRDEREIRKSLKGPPLINFNNACLNMMDKNILSDININLDGGLTIVYGAVGSGKSTFLKTILQDHVPDKGILTVRGSISYASQEPWLFPASIKKNILLGQEYDSRRYQEVLRVCALTYDLGLLKNGDSTIVGDGGANLSKGQQSRINLARAIYKKSDIYLLDDPLCGLDANVSSFVFYEAIKNFLNDKLVVLVTHKTDLLKEAKQVIYFDNGTVKDLVEFEISTDDASTLNVEKAEDPFIENVEDIPDESAKLVNVVEDNIYKEKKKSGKIDYKTYVKYVNFGGGFVAILLVFCIQILVNVALSYRLKLVGDWVNIEEAIVFSFNSTNKSLELELEEEHKSVFYKYSSAIGILITGAVARGFVLLAFTTTASVKIHKKMINQIIHCCTEFFDQIFLGNILNRFSKDITAIDELMPFAVFQLIRGVATLPATVIMIAIVDKLFFIPMAILSVAMYFCRKYTIKTTTNIKRLEASVRSPVVGHIHATLKGLTTIKAFGAENTVKNEFDHYQDIYASTSYAYGGTSKAFFLILDIISTIFTTIVLVTFFVGKHDVAAGYVGLAISQALILIEVLNGLFASSSDFENQATSVERALEYTKLPQESNTGLEPENWPKFGQITFENVYLSYPNSINVLRNINFAVEPGEKIGIVGRTGAGKSSLISALFRMYEIEGKVRIDGVDLKTLSHSFLRSKISIIPQEPFLFSGTIRDNIDPFGKYSDVEIWAAIEKVNMKENVPSLNILVGNLNLSVGQKQLLCIAKTIIKKNKIVILDEATANTDVETEKLIHHSIEANFLDCTVLTIAHNLQTVLNSDRIMVLENGNIIEFDHPAVLLKNEDGAFFKMVQRAGLLPN